MEWARQQLANPNAKDEVLNYIGQITGKYGFPAADMVSRQYVRELLQRQVDVIMTTLPDADAQRVLGAIEPIWFPA